MVRVRLLLLFLCFTNWQDAGTSRCTKNIFVSSSYTLRSKGYPASKPRYRPCKVITYVMQTSDTNLLTMSCPDFKVYCPNHIAVLGKEVCGTEFPSVTTTSSSLTVKVTGKKNYKRYAKQRKVLRFSCFVESIARPTTTFCDCGTNALSNRIIGGSLATYKEFPYHAAIVFVRDGRRYYKCGGSLISDQWATTAAHCGMTTTDLVGLGNHQISVVNEGQLWIGITEVHTYPLYNTTTKRFDISIVKLEQRVTFNEYVRPACLPDAYQFDSLEGYTAEHSGWGRTESGGISDVLKKTQDNIISNSLCEQFFVNGVFPDSVCTMTNDTSGCHGDSGGGLVIRSGGRAYLIGVLSYGVKSCNPNNVPNVFVRVAVPNVLNWIKTTAGIDCTAP